MMIARPAPFILTASTCILLASSVFGGGSPGCPPSFCPPVDASNPDGIARLTLFPGTTSVVTDNGPGDLEPSICGLLRVSNVPFPGLPWASGSATFSGTIYMIPPDPAAATPGQLVVTNAVIHNDSGAAGADEDFQVQDPLPLACGEFFNTQGTVPAAFSVNISGTLETDSADDVLAGGEEFNLEGRALKFTTTSPISSPPPGRNFVEVLGPPSGSSTPGPYPLSASGTIFGTYEPGAGVIGLIMGGVLPSGELIRLPNSIEATFGQVMPPTVPDGSGGTTPLTVAKLDEAASQLLLNWDAASCNGSESKTTLIYGEGSGLFMAAAGEAIEPLGAVCDLGQTPPFLWEGVPDAQDESRLLWWLLVRREEETGTEGSWGLDSMGNERGGSGQNGSSGLCQSTDKQVTHACLP